MTVKLHLFLLLSGGLLVGALLLGRPELVVLAAPFAVSLVVGLALAEPPEVQVELSVSPDRLLEGETATVTVRVASATAIPRLEVAVGLPPGLRPQDGRRVRVVAVPAGAPVLVELPVEAERWGAHMLGPVAWRARDVAGLTVVEGSEDLHQPLRAYPRPETLRDLAPPLETQVFVGNRRARMRGDGVEFAELRPFVPGDRVRQVNWRVAARGRGLWVNERHPERNSDVVVFVDTYADGGLDRSVRAAAALVDAYGATRDRVGLVGFGGSLRWVEPGMGLAHLHRVVEVLIDTRVFVSYVWRGVRAMPVRTLPAKALVVALSPLADERMVAALVDLRHRGVDLAVVEVAPPVPAALAPGAEAIGHRAWLVEREMLRRRFRRLGVAVAQWTADRPVVSVVEELTTVRRHASRPTG